MTRFLGIDFDSDEPIALTCIPPPKGFPPYESGSVWLALPLDAKPPAPAGFAESRLVIASEWRVWANYRRAAEE